MSALVIDDLSSSQRGEMFPEKVIPLTRVSGNRIIRSDVRAYCESKNMSEVNILACVEIAVLAHSVEAGTKTADRLIAKNRARSFRHNHFNDPKDIA